MSSLLGNVCCLAVAASFVSSHIPAHMNLRQSFMKEESLSTYFPFTAQVPRYQYPVSIPQGLSQHGDKAGQGWAGQDLVYSASKSQHTQDNSWGCQSSTWSDHPCFCDLFSLKMASVYLKSISVGSKSLALLLSQTMSPSSQAKISLYIFTHSKRGYWSEASRGF